MTKQGRLAFLETECLEALWEQFPERGRDEVTRHFARLMARPGRIRTPDTWVRSPVLCPAELRARGEKGWHSAENDWVNQERVGTANWHLGPVGG